MAEYSRFFGGEEGSEPEYTQVNFAEVLAKIFSNGVFADINDELAVVENDPASLSVVIGLGEAWINGYWYQNTADLVKSLAAADPDNDRIDRIVLRLDTVTNFKISVEVLAGTPAGSPSAPALTQTATTYEISLAQVLVEATVTSVADAKITDERDFVEVTYAPDVDITGLTPLSGWISVSDSWSYASASTITVPSGAALLYQVGDKIKITQTTDKFFYISAVADTTLTVNGAGLYTVADAAITAKSYSRVAQPFGFPIDMTSGYCKCRAYLSADQDNIAGAGAGTYKINLNAESYDIGSDFDTGNYRYVAPVTGYYQVDACVTWESADFSAGTYITSIFVNGSEYTQQYTYQATASKFTAIPISDIVYAGAGQYIELKIYTDDTNVDVYGGANSTFMSISLVSIL